MIRKFSVTLVYVALSVMWHSGIAQAHDPDTCSQTSFGFFSISSNTADMNTVLFRIEKEKEFQILVLPKPRGVVVNIYQTNGHIEKKRLEGGETILAKGYQVILIKDRRDSHANGCYRFVKLYPDS